MSGKRTGGGDGLGVGESGGLDYSAKSAGVVGAGGGKKTSQSVRLVVPIEVDNTWKDIIRTESQRKKLWIWKWSPNNNNNEENSNFHFPTKDSSINSQSHSFPSKKQLQTRKISDQQKIRDLNVSRSEKRDENRKEGTATAEDVKSSPPFPIKSSGQIGWRSSKKGNILEIYPTKGRVRDWAVVEKIHFTSEQYGYYRMKKYEAEAERKRMDIEEKEKKEKSGSLISATCPNNSSSSFHSFNNFGTLPSRRIVYIAKPLLC